ncbi:sensor histidine kinase [Actinophytocola sp.]|uniref:sensor histidine kinase n=1 Tax=Actinophytocola sp. TaxID=1872138 RepID=UPI0025B7BCF0|nr:sensor histidine kinase [Actinophytocola sp.]
MRKWEPAGAVLALASVVEALVRAGSLLVFALLVGLFATAPLAFARGHAAAAAAVITPAAALSVVLYRGPATGLVALVVVWALILTRLVRRARADAASRTASARAVESTLLELTARGERARIARELHDVVAHHISMISVQAETARLATPGMPPEGARKLQAIGDTARTALTEMRRLLGVLREDAGTEPTRAPQPGLQQLLDLIDEMRTSASARLIVSGQVTPLDPGVELIAYRIVQEALTNARRHAPGAAVDVEIAYADDELRLTVRDNGPGPPPHTRGNGHGLLGMRERVATVGGTLHTGPAPVSGFLVEATLPTARS